MSARRRHKVGLSLAETVTAIFIFVAGGLVCFELALSACWNSSKVEQLTQATLIGESCLDQIRQWAYQPDNYLSNWAIYDNQPVAGIDPPGYQVRTFVAASQRAPLSPCTALSAGYSLIAITNSMREVRVQVSWGSGGVNQQVNLNALIAEPARNIRGANRLVITRIPPVVSPLPVNATTQVAVDLYDTSDRPIEGICYNWSAQADWSSGLPGGGMGTIRDLPSSPTRNQIELLNHFYRGDPNNPTPPESLPGWVLLKASCRYDGVDYAQDSAPIRLGP